MSIDDKFVRVLLAMEGWMNIIISQTIKRMLMSQNQQQKTKCLRSNEENETLSSIALRRTRKKKKRHIYLEKKIRNRQYMLVISVRIDNLLNT